MTNANAPQSSAPQSPIVVNKIMACKKENANNKKVIQRAALKYLILHRTSLRVLDEDANPRPLPDPILDGPALAARFKNPGLGTSGLIPYTFLICANDPIFTIEQLLPVTIRGAHAIGYNWQSIGIACVWDCTKSMPPPEMYKKIVQLVSVLLPINGGLLVAGHTDLPGAAADPKKVCPGPYLSAKQVASDATRQIPMKWRTWQTGYVNMRLIGAGITI